jgi:hypothetical protein
MRKPEVEKKANIENLTSELCWWNSNYYTDAEFNANKLFVNNLRK